MVALDTLIFNGISRFQTVLFHRSGRHAGFSALLSPPSSSQTLKPRWANRKAAAALRRPLWQYATYSLERSSTSNMLRTSASGTLIAPGSLSYWYSDG